MCLLHTKIQCTEMKIVDLQERFLDIFNSGLWFSRYPNSAGIRCLMRVIIPYVFIIPPSLYLYPAKIRNMPFSCGTIIIIVL